MQNAPSSESWSCQLHSVPSLDPVLPAVSGVRGPICCLYRPVTPRQRWQALLQAQAAIGGVCCTQPKRYVPYAVSQPPPGPPVSLDLWACGVILLSELFNGKKTQAGHLGSGGRLGGGDPCCGGRSCASQARLHRLWSSGCILGPWMQPEDTGSSGQRRDDSRAASITQQEGQSPWRG